MRPVRVSSFTHLSETGFLTCTRFVPPDRDALPPDELFPLLLMFVPIGMPYCSKRSGGSATIARTLISEANGSLSIQRQALITDQIQAIVAPASPGFWPNLGSGGEPECLHFIGVLSFDDEFREAVA